MVFVRALVVGVPGRSDPDAPLEAVLRRGGAHYAAYSHRTADSHSRRDAASVARRRPACCDFRSQLSPPNPECRPAEATECVFRRILAQSLHCCAKIAPIGIVVGMHPCPITR